MILKIFQSKCLGNLSLLVHPNTGYEYEDHSTWAMWAGQPWPLDMSIFDKETQTNEFGVFILSSLP
jgi:aromatic ring-cleaving dioxygenase